MLNRRLPDLSLLMRGQRFLQAAAGLLVAGLRVCNPVQAVDILENSLGTRFIQVPAGSFTKGSVEVEAACMDCVLTAGPPGKAAIR